MRTAVMMSREVSQADAVTAKAHLLGKRVSIVPSCHSATLRHWANPSRQLICALLTPSGLDSLSTLEGPVSPAICHPRHYRPAPHCSIFGNFRHLCASITRPAQPIQRHRLQSALPHTPDTLRPRFHSEAPFHLLCIREAH